MAKKLFEHIKEAHDGIGRVIFVCKDQNGMYVYKPTSGFKSKHYSDEESEDLEACFERQKGCNHTHAFYEESERPTDTDVYPSFDEVATGTVPAAKPTTPKAAKPKVVKPAAKKTATKKSK